MNSRGKDRGHNQQSRASDNQALFLMDFPHTHQGHLQGCAHSLSSCWTFQRHDLRVLSGVLDTG